MTGSRPSRERLRDLTRSFSGLRVAVVADLVADEYLLCRTSRISREAPAALILAHEGREVRPGGGANAIANLKALGAEVAAVGVVGDDAFGTDLLDALAALKVDCAGIQVERSYRTVVKSRVLTSYHHSTRQQVLRIDREDRLEPGGAPAAGVAARAGQALAGARALLVSDYGYGAASPDTVGRAVSAARGLGLPVTLDSRYRLLEHAGITAATPNEPEAEAALGFAIGDDLAALSRAGRLLLERLRAEAVLITRGSKGMAVFERGLEAEHIPVFGSDQVADVTGAGDTVIAAFTLALAAGASALEAAHLANVAGGIVVMKLGTATVSAAELQHALVNGPGA